MPSIAFDAMETPLGVAGARARNSVGSSDWQALCDLEAELESVRASAKKDRDFQKQRIAALVQRVAALESV